MNKTYFELSGLKTYEERFEYAKLSGVVGQDTFGSRRYLNQILYRTPEWKEIRRKVIMRDNGCDLGMSGYEICGQILVHHLNPITVDDILSRSANVFDLNNLICVSLNTHNAIHYGDKDLLILPPIERSANDTCPWKH